MTLERLSRRDKWLLLIVVAITAASAMYTWRNYGAAFPEASINLRYSKEEITRMAERFLRHRELSTACYRNLTLFEPDDAASTYLERELDLTQANRLMQDQVSVWRWRARWFRPPEQEEMHVYLSPAGKLVGFQHTIPEAATGARLDKDAARRLASDFLSQQTRAPHRLIEEQLRERPARFDYSFTWEQKGFQAKDATYRRTVVVQGGRIGHYSEFLHIPEQWRRDFAALRSKNELYAQVATALYLPLVLAAVVLVIQAFRRRQLRWRPLVAIAGAVGVLMILNRWNMLPFFVDQMPTSSPLSKSLVFGLLQGLGAGVGVFFYVILAAAAGAPLYGRSQPGHAALRALVSPKVVRTREFFLATVTGYGFTAVHIAYVVAFYLIGRRFGVWSPQEINYSDFLSTWFPWLYPLTISLFASTSEEFWFRLLAIPLLKRWLRSTWLAVLIPAFIWGFLHSTYPQQPGYIRGLEVGVIGVAAGFLMLRFGILATLIWHYTVDAILIGMFLLRAESWYFQASGWLVGGAVFLPLLVSVAFYLRHRGFQVEPELLNAGEPAPEDHRMAAVVGPRLEALPPQWPLRRLYTAAVIVAAAGLAFAPYRFGDFLRLRLTRADAARAAMTEFKRLVPDPEAWRHVTRFVPRLETEEFEFLRREVGGRRANEIVRERTATGFWFVRCFQPQRKEEWHFYVDQQGRVFSRSHVLDEKAPGASLAAEEARAIAEAYLAREQGLAIERHRLVDAASEKKERRTDHDFTWEDSSFRAGEAKARVSVDVIGDEVSGYQRFLKLPEEWLRDFHKPRLAALLIPGSAGAIGLLLLVGFFRRLGQRSPEGGSAHRFHWRLHIASAASGLVLMALASWNASPLFFAGYDTARPVENYITEVLLAHVMRAAFVGFALFLATLAADVFFQMAIGDRRLPRASALCALAIFLLGWGTSRVLDGVEQWIPGPRLSLSLWSLPGVDTLLPAVSVLIRAVFSTAAFLCLLAVAVSAACRYLSARRRLALCAALAVIYAASRAQNWPQFAYGVLVFAVLLGLLVLVLKTSATNLVAVGVGWFWLEVFGPAATLLEQPAAAFRWNGLLCLAMAAVAGLAVIRVRARTNGPGQPL